MWPDREADVEPGEIMPGVRVVIRTANGDDLPRIACSGIEPGGTFPLVWVCSEEEWDTAQRQHRRPESIPWPAENVVVERKAATG